MGRGFEGGLWSDRTAESDLRRSGLYVGRIVPIVAEFLSCPFKDRRVPASPGVSGRAASFRQAGLRPLRALLPCIHGRTQIGCRVSRENDGRRRRRSTGGGRFQLTKNLCTIRL